MAPPRKHQTDAILDATRELVLTDGPRAASVAAIAKASGAPAGTLYHRFGNRDGIVIAAWLRALERFQAGVLSASGEGPLATAVAMAVAAVEFARQLPEDARLLLLIRPADLLDGELDRAFADRLAVMNEPLVQRVDSVAQALYGSADARAVAAVSRAVVDLPYAVVRRYAGDDAVPEWLEADIATGTKALLEAYRPANLSAL